MNVESELRKDGIEIIGRLDTLSVNSISRNAAEKKFAKHFLELISIMVNYLSSFLELQCI